jgi:hypothetical protein
LILSGNEGRGTYTQLQIANRRNTPLKILEVKTTVPLYDVIDDVKWGFR